MDPDLLNEDMPDLTKYGEEETPPVVEPEPPAYVTKEDFALFANQMATQIAAALKPEVAKSQDEPDWEEGFLTKAEARSTQKYLELSKPTFVAQIVNTVAGDYPKNVQDTIKNLLSGMNGQAIAELTQNPQGLEHFSMVAAGAQVKLNPGKTAAPRSAPSGTVGGSTAKEQDLAQKFYEEYKELGVTKEQAAAMAKEQM